MTTRTRGAPRAIGTAAAARTAAPRPPGGPVAGLTVLLIHGLLREHDREALDRIEAGEVHPRAVAAGGLAAAVSEAPDHGLTADDAVAHLDLLVALAAAVPVLPMPLGTTAPDDDAVREEVLAPAADQLARQLAAIADVVELRLDLAFETDAVVAEIARDDQEIELLAAQSRAAGGGLADRLALGEAVAARVATAETALTERWTAGIAAIAERSAVLSAGQEIRADGLAGPPRPAGRGGRRGGAAAGGRQRNGIPTRVRRTDFTSTASWTTSRRARSPSRALDGGGEPTRRRRDGARHARGMPHGTRSDSTGGVQ